MTDSSTGCLQKEGVPPQFIEKKSAFKRLRLYLIKPSKYDDDGYVIRHWKGVLPSNTLACLYSLTLDINDRGVFGENLKWDIQVIDETVQKVETAKIVKEGRRKGTKTVIALVGVQSNQFSRAADLAMDFRQAGLDTLIGGFHVSGVLATFPELTPELAVLKNAGITLVGGEVEEKWELLLRDAIEGKLRPVYNFLTQIPSLERAPVPRIPENVLNRYVIRHFATLDCGRGCPYQCSFCTVINVQGRQMRYRPVKAILDRIRQNYRQHKIQYYFFTDDNFCRNKNWESIFDGLVRLREEEKIAVSFMMQVDTQSFRIKNFIEKAGRAGCSQVFIGMESLNESNLQSAGKKQNDTGCFKELIDAYHDAGIVTHLAYIIGFPFDTEQSLRRDMVRLRRLGAEQASFFMMTPLPGSMDYKQVFWGQKILDQDLNNYDSFHETFAHDNLKNGTWMRSYKNAWRDFYSVTHMADILRNAHPSKYWRVFLNFVWYKNAVQVEGGHPMINGFFRLKGRRNRRPGYPLETRWNYFKRRVSDIKGTLAGWIKLTLEMEDVWLLTRRRSPLEQQVVQEFLRRRTQVAEWRTLKLTDLQQLYHKAAMVLERKPALKQNSQPHIPSRFRLWFRKWNVFSDSLTVTRRPMMEFWKEMFSRLKSGRIHKISFPRVAFICFQESVLMTRFLLSLLSQLIRDKERMYTA